METECVFKKIRHGVLLLTLTAFFVVNLLPILEASAEPYPDCPGGQWKVCVFVSNIGFTCVDSGQPEHCKTDP